MKEFAKLFARRYSVVKADEEQTTATPTAAAAGAALSGRLRRPVNVYPADRRVARSLKANGSIYPAGILRSFFNERRANGRARSPKCAFVLLALGILAISAAILVKILHPYDLIFRWKLVMREDGEIFNLWAKPPVDLYIKIYLFNITNAEAFMAGREKMHVQQVGPYVYKELMTHENVSFNANNTISTNPSHPLVWQEHLSEGHREEDEVVMLNIAMLAIAHLTADKPYFIRMALNTLFVTSGSQPIVRMTAREFMFGYATSLTSLGNRFLPNWISFDKVGLIDRMYDFDDDYETFYVGIPDSRTSGLYATYRGRKDLPHWNGDHCSNIEGASDGTKWPSFIRPNDTLKFFRKSMCRPINLYREGERQKYGSLTGYKYVFEKHALDNGVINEKNKCFCRYGYCQPQGLIDVTDCYYGFPISLSYPHFMDGDPGLQTNITGLKPNKETHSSAFIVQPESGLPLSLSAKVQINMHFKNMRAYGRTSRFSHLTVPMLWFDITMAKLSEDLDTRFNFYLNILPHIDGISFWGSLLAGLALLIYAVTRATLRLSSIPQTTPLADGKYAKANLLLSKSTAPVYNPCEMQLIQTRATATGGPVAMRASLCDKGPVRSYTEIDLTRSRRHSDFALEMESAITGLEGGRASSSSGSSGSSGDEGNESDTATLTLNRNSISSLCSDVQSHSDDTHSNGRTDGDKQTSISLNSSGYESSLTDSQVDAADLRSTKSRHQTRVCGV